MINKVDYVVNMSDSLEELTDKMQSAMTSIVQTDRRIVSTQIVSESGYYTGLIFFAYQQPFPEVR